MNRKLIRAGAIASAALVAVIGAVALGSPAEGVATVSMWSPAETLNNITPFSSPPAGTIDPGSWGSEFPRMTKTGANSWIMVFTEMTNDDYQNDPSGGSTLQVETSTDNARTWTVGPTLSTPGLDMDNGQILVLANGTMLLASRSVIWQQSYSLPVYKSTDGGATWTYLSTIDSNSGAPGALGSPDKGVYEPFMYQLPNGNVTVLYANEKHVTETPSYSQVISERSSSDNGATWGSESYAVADTTNSASRPGMPVVTRMSNGSYMVVFEVCGTHSCDVYDKTSNDGTTWGSGIGSAIPSQNGGPYVTSLRDGRLVVTSNSGAMSLSNDLGATWNLNPASPWSGSGSGSYWSSIYQTGDDEVATLDSVQRSAGGHNIQIRFGALPEELEAEDATVHDALIETGYSTASQGSFVGGINNSDSYVEFPHVNVSQAGTYRLTVNYDNGGSAATHLLTVNGVAAGSVSYAPTGSWGSFPYTTSVDVSLNAGDNTIRLTKGTNYAEVDQISVARYEAESATTTDAIRYYGVGSSPSGGGYVGGIDNSDSSVQFAAVNAIVSGTYTLRIRYANGGSSATHALTVNGASAGTVSYAATGGWGVFATTTVAVTLAQGDNSITFGKGTNYAEIDYVEAYK